MTLTKYTTAIFFDRIEEIKGIKNAVIVTDPPFNIGYHYTNFCDKKSQDQYYAELSRLLDLPCVVIHYPESLHRLSLVSNRTPNKVVSWIYNSNTPRQHRDIAYYGLMPEFRGLGKYKNTNDKRIQKLIAEGKSCRGYDWIECQQIKNVSKEKTKHPCQMPLTVMDYVVKTIPNDSVIIDPFCGSGTTLLAAKINGYKYVGFELVKEYHEIATKRLNVLK